MASSLPNKCCVKSTGNKHHHCTEEHWPLELIRSRENDRRDVRVDLKGILEGRFNGRESPPVACVNFLTPKALVTEAPMSDIQKVGDHLPGEVEDGKVEQRRRYRWQEYRTGVVERQAPEERCGPRQWLC